MKLKPFRPYLMAGLALLSLASSPLVLADSAAQTGAKPAASAPKDANVQATQPGVQKEAEKQTAEQRHKIIQEAVTAVQETAKALQALDKGDSEAALKSLEIATGKLELILARDPKLAFAPVDVSMVTLDLYADLETIKKARKDAEEALEDGEVQKARALLANLASEIVISVTKLPLATYPEAIKAVTPLIDAGKIDEAKHALQAALNTLVVEDIVIPLPPLRASLMLKAADKLAQKKDRSEDENKKLKELLDAAENQIRMAEALGYGKKKDYKPLYEEMEKIREKTSGGKSGSGFFDEILRKLGEITD